MAIVHRVLWHRIGHGGGSLMCALLIFYGFPERLSFERLGVGVVAFCIGTVGLVLLAIVQTNRLIRSSPASQQRARFVGVLSLASIATCFFALTYFLLAHSEQEQFEGLRTRTDALYYSVVTLATVGYGDVHPVGQAARIATTVHVAFNLVVIGALLAVASSLFADQMRDRREAGDNGPHGHP